MGNRSIAIVGGGILGRLLALELFERGELVTLFEKGDSNGSSACGYVGLGMLAPWSELPNLPPDDFVTLKLGVLSLDRWPFLLNKIGAVQNYLNKGCLIVARREEFASIEYLKKIIYRSSISADFQSCHQQDILHYEPEISKNFFHGIFLPKEGCLDTRSLFIALTNYFSRIKLPVFYNCGECILKTQNEICIPRFSPDSQKFDYIIDTRGLGAKTLENGLRGVRGETLRVFAPDVHISRQVRVFDTKLPLYVSPRGNSIYSLGATCIESEDTKSMTVRSVLEILSMARYVHEGFMESHILEMNVQWRPAYTNNLPKIIVKDSFMSINGLYRHGIMCAPALASICADLLTKKSEKMLPMEALLVCEN